MTIFIRGLNNFTPGQKSRPSVFSLISVFFPLLSYLSLFFSFTVSLSE